VYRIIQPEWVIASGGIPDPNSQTLPESSVIRDTLGPLGVPAERVILESDSVNTSEQVANVAKLLERRHIAGTVVFVTSPHHSKRVMLLARRHGINAIISPAERATFDPLLGWDTWRPSVGNLRRSEMAIYEYLAWVKDWMVASW
jgi:uncharacterized SAM-binding protein YcdF (DUF218 family)